MIFYGIFMVIAVVGAAASLIGYLKKWNKARFILNASWCILGLLTMLGFIICVILSLLSIVFMETCD